MKQLIITTRIKFWIFIILFLTHSMVTAAIIVVDRDDDILLPGNGGCSLRDAINSANLNLALEGCTAGDANTMDTINVNVAGPIQLSNQIHIISSMSISPNLNAPRVTIIAAENRRIFSVHPLTIEDDDFQIANLRLIDGDAGLENGGAILFSDFPIYSNNAEAVIINIMQCEFENNLSTRGGAIDFDNVDAAEITIDQSIFTNNIASDAGAIYGENLTYDGTLKLNNNIFKSNMTTLGSGGAILIKDSNILPYEINNNLFLGNISSSTAGAIFLFKSPGSIQYNLAGNVFLLNYSGATGGAIYINRVDLYLTNNTFAFNSAASAGAIFNWNSQTFKMANSTFLYNEARSNTAAHLQISGIGGDETIQIGNSIIANPLGEASNCDFSLSISPSIGSNISDDTSCELNHISDVIADPQLSGLVYHDSGLPGFIPIANSPALDTSLSADCLDANGSIINLDQQGNPRTTDGDNDGNAYCDSGAIEAPANTDLIWADSLGG